MGDFCPKTLNCMVQWVAGAVGNPYTGKRYILFNPNVIEKEIIMCKLHFNLNLAPNTNVASGHPSVTPAQQFRDKLYKASKRIRKEAAKLKKTK